MEREKFEEFFRQFYEKDLMRAASKGEKFIIVDFQELDKFDPLLADKLLEDPNQMLEEAKEAITQIDLPEGTIKATPRFKNLPESSFVRIRNLRAEHMGKFVSLDGVVRRASEVKPEISLVIFQCPDCGSKISVIQKEKIIVYPGVCDCGRKGNFEILDKKLFDARWLTIEEPFETATAERPGMINVFLTRDLTTPAMQRKGDPGNRLKVNGIIKEIKKTIKGKLKSQIDFYIEANYFESTEIEWEEVNVSEEDEKKIKGFSKDPEIYKKIVASVAPSLYGMEEIKEAVAYQLFGGVPRNLPDGTRIRGDIHILIVGDPSIGKTQILKLVSKVIPRGKYVSGKGVTGVGLTASVSKDEEFMGGWVLEAGAMVLCHKGMIAIDEFDKMNKDDQVAMHEAMSTQTISIAKASIVATLPSQTAVLAGANPKYSRFDPFRSIVEQVDIPDTLLSRFDLKFMLRDVPNKEMDAKLAGHVMDSRLTPENIAPLIDTQFLRKYIAYARHSVNPEMNKEAADRLKDFYLTMRGMYAGEEKQTIAITLRQYDALIRLAEASARIRLSSEVTIEDAERVIRIMEASIRQLGYDRETGKIDIDRTEGVSSSRRNKITTMLNIIDKLEKTFGRAIPKEEILIAAQDEGLSETDADKILDSLKKEGRVFEPKMNQIQRV